MSYSGKVRRACSDFAGRSSIGRDLVRYGLAIPTLDIASFFILLTLSIYANPRRRKYFQDISRQITSVEIKLPVPAQPEQRKIAAVLGLVQRAIEQQERLIALTTELKKALLHKLFTEGLRGEPQKQTEIGPVPESWEVCDARFLSKSGQRFDAEARQRRLLGRWFDSLAQQHENHERFHHGEQTSSSRTSPSKKLPATHEAHVVYS